MIRKEKPSGFVSALIVGVAAGWIVTILTAALTAYLIHSEIIQAQTGTYATMISLLLGSSVSALIAAIKIPQNRLLICASAGVAFFVSLICIAAILFDGAKEGILPSLGMVFGGCFVVYLLGLKTASKRKYKMPKLPR